MLLPGQWRLLVAPAVLTTGCLSSSNDRQRGGSLDRSSRTPLLLGPHATRHPTAACAEANAKVTDWADPTAAAKLDKNYRSAEVLAQRKEIGAMLALKPGESVLDVGCGPGLMLEEMAGVVGSRGSAVGIDPSEAMLALARGRLSKVPTASVQVGTAEELPFADSSFDAVVLSQVLLYVEDVSKALKEVYRVLKPGGRVVICDTDWNNLVVNTADRARFDEIFKAVCSTFVDAHLPPKLPGLLQGAGLEVRDVRTVPMLGCGEGVPDGSTFIGNWAFKVVPEKILKYGLPQSYADDWLREQHQLSERQAFFACVHRFIFRAERPK